MGIEKRNAVAEEYPERGGGREQETGGGVRKLRGGGGERGGGLKRTRGLVGRRLMNLYYVILLITI